MADLIPLMLNMIRMLKSIAITYLGRIECHSPYSVAHFMSKIALTVFESLLSWKKMILNVYGILF